MSPTHTQQAQCLTQNEVPYLPCIRQPRGGCINLAFVAEWDRVNDGSLVLVMAYPSYDKKGYPQMIALAPGRFADWVEGLLDAVVLDGPDS